MPTVHGRRSSAAKASTACAIDSRGASGARGSGGSCTCHAISPQAATEQPASTKKPMRHDVASTSHASGVPVTSRPMPPTLRIRPETAAKRSGGKWRAMNTVHTRKAAAQPMPISTCPSTSTAYPGASADSSAPAIASGKAVSTVRRTPCRSMPTPMASCSAPNAKWNAPAKVPSCCGDSPNSACSGAARIAPTVRKAWLIVNAAVSVSSIAHGSASRGGGGDAAASGTGRRRWGFGLEPAAQFGLGDLLQRRAREVVDQPQLVRLLEVGKLRRASGADAVEQVRRRVHGGQHEQHRHLVEHRMLPGDDRTFVHAGDLQHDALDLARGDVLAADLQHVLGAVAETQAAVVEHLDPVAGAKPAVGVEGLGGGT